MGKNIAVHCSTKDQWNFACNHYSKGVAINDYPRLDTFRYLGSSSGFRGWETKEYYYDNDVSIISFEEWLNREGIRHEWKNSYTHGELLIGTSFSGDTWLWLHDAYTEDRTNPHIACICLDEEEYTSTKGHMGEFGSVRRATKSDIDTLHSFGYEIKHASFQKIVTTGLTLSKPTINKSKYFPSEDDNSLESLLDEI